jgi:hypothetical protein
MLGLELDPHIDEAPSKGGMGVKIYHKGKICHVGNDLGESLEGMGCLSKAVRDNRLVFGVGMGDASMPVEFGAVIGQGRRLIAFLAEPERHDKHDCTIMLSGVGGYQGDSGKVVLDVDSQTQLCKHNPFMGEGVKHVVLEGNSSGLGLEGKGGLLSYTT